MQLTSEKSLCLVYPLLRNEREEVQNFVNKHLRKGYIQPSKSQQTSPVFFVGKMSATDVTPRAGIKPTTRQSSFKGQKENSTEFLLNYNQLYILLHCLSMYQYSHVNLLVLMSNLISSYSNLTDPHKGHTSLPYCHTLCLLLHSADIYYQLISLHHLTL